MTSATVFVSLLYLVKRENNVVISGAAIHPGQERDKNDRGQHLQSVGKAATIQHIDSIEGNSTSPTTTTATGAIVYTQS